MPAPPSPLRCVFAATVLASAVLSGCASTHGLQPALAPDDADTLAVSRSFDGAKLSAAAWPTQDWWHDWGDPQLDALIAEAQAAEQQDFKLLQDKVTAEEIAEVVSRATGIPVSKMMQGEREKLLHMEDRLHQRVVVHRIHVGLADRVVDHDVAADLVQRHLGRVGPGRIGIIAGERILFVRWRGRRSRGLRGRLRGGRQCADAYRAG